MAAYLETLRKYKYLGVIIGLGRASDIFKHQRKTIVSRLRSYAGLILSLARESFDPIEVGEALWKSVALESILHGIQVTSVTKANIAQLDSIQACFAADLIGVRRSCSHPAILRELDWQTLSSTIMKRKLLFWARLSQLDKNTWATKL